MRVFKFGGASVKDADGIKNVYDVLQKVGYEDVLLVVSAMGKTTNALEVVVAAYFDKSAANVNRDESALLIAMLTNPKYYESHQSDKRLRNKQRIIKKRMKNAVLPQSA